MGRVLSLWWSLLWRITLATLAISFPVAQLVSSFAGSDPDWIKLEPTVAWAGGRDFLGYRHRCGGLLQRSVERQ